MERARLHWSLIAVALVSCSSHGSVHAGGGPEAGVTDSGSSTTDGGSTDGGPVEAGEAGDAGPSPITLPYCVEAEKLAQQGDVRAWPGVATTVGGVVVPAGDPSARLALPFRLAKASALEVWVRVRAVTHSNNSLYVGMDSLDTKPAADSIWDVPVTPVLRWEWALQRGATGTDYRADATDWPGTLPAGDHTLVLAGREPAVALDAVCLTAPGGAPAERFASPPAHAKVKSAKDYGAVGDGVADDTKALQAALDSLSPGDTLRIPAGRYRTTGALVLSTSDVTIEGERNGDQLLSTLFFDFDPATSDDGLRLKGPADGSPVPLVADADLLDREIVVAANASFTKGDRVRLTSDDWGPDNADLVADGRAHTATQRFREAFANVMSTHSESDGKHLVLDRPLLSPFTLAHNAKVELYHPLTGVVVRWLHMDGTQHLTASDPTGNWTDAQRASNANVTFVHGERCADCFFYGLDLSHFRRQALRLDDSLDCQVFDNTVRDATDWDGNSHGYGIGPTHSQGIVVRENHFHGVMRHPMYISWGDRESFYYGNDVVRPAVSHPWESVNIDVHGEDDYANLIENNQITRGSTGVVIGGGGSSHGNDGPWNVVRANTINDAGQGIVVSDHSPDEIVDRNTITNSTEYDLLVRQGAERTQVWHNHAVAWGTYGLYVWASFDTAIFSNIFQSGPDPTINLSSSCTGYDIEDNTLNGGKIVEPGAGTVAGNH